VVKPATALKNRFEPEPVWAKEIETEFLVTSRRAAQMNAQQMLWADRRYWGIETGLHLRLDVIAGEDRSRVRNRTSAIKPSTS